MEKAKPIVPGCLCMVLPHGMGRYTGAICTARFQLPGNLFDCKGAPVGGNWLTDLPMITVKGEKKRVCVNARFLMRIDDPDTDLQLKSEKPKEEPCH